jgi:hypothetical protein
VLILWASNQTLFAEERPEDRKRPVLCISSARFGSREGRSSGVAGFRTGACAANLNYWAKRRLRRKYPNPATLNPVLSSTLSRTINGVNPDSATPEFCLLFGTIPTNFSKL